MKIAIVYHSVSGNTKKIAEFVASGVEKSGVDEVKLMSIDSIDYDFIEKSQGVIFGTPTYYASMSWQMKKWFDTSTCKLSGKLGSCFATANFMGGGSEVAEGALVHHMLVKGMVVYTAGGGEGLPFTHLGATSIREGDEFQQNRAVIFGERIGRKALELFKLS